MPTCDLSSKIAQRRTLDALPPRGLAALYLAALGWHRRQRGEAATAELLAALGRAAKRGGCFPLSPAQAATVALLRGARSGDSREAIARHRARVVELYEAARRGTLYPELWAATMPGWALSKIDGRPVDCHCALPRQGS